MCGYGFCVSYLNVVHLCSYMLLYVALNHLKLIYNVFFVECSYVKPLSFLLFLVVPSNEK